MKRNTERNEAIYALHKTGLSYAKIARLYLPITRQRIGQIVKDARKSYQHP